MFESTESNTFWCIRNSCSNFHFFCFPTIFPNTNPKGHLICLLGNLSRTIVNKIEKTKILPSVDKMVNNQPISNLPALISAVEKLENQEISTVKKDNKGRTIFKDKNGYYIM